MSQYKESDFEKGRDEGTVFKMVSKKITQVGCVKNLFENGRKELSLTEGSMDEAEKVVESGSFC